MPTRDSRAEYEHRIHRVLEHIDRHLDAPLDLAALAEVAHFSPFHFHRLFAAWMGETLGDYVRRRRVEVGASCLAAQPRLPVLNVALSVGFGSAEAFARAFRAHFGSAPSVWRSRRASLRAQQRNPGQVRSNPGQAPGAIARQHEASRNPHPELAMNVKIIERPPTKVAYLRKTGPYGTAVGEFWRYTVAPWLGANGWMDQARYGISHDDPSITDPALCRYDACVELPKGVTPTARELQTTLPGGRYAVLHFEGTSQQIGEAWAQLLRDWLPASGLQLDARVLRALPGRLAPRPEDRRLRLRHLHSGERAVRRALELVGTLAVLGGLACSAARAEPVPARANPVGLMSVRYEDAARREWGGEGKRPLATAVWYPAVPGSPEAEWSVAIFNAGRNAIGAPMAASPARLPLVVLSHGTGGSAAAMAWLGETLAANGYLVAAVNHHGNTAAGSTPRREGFLVWWDRPQDVSVLIDALLADPRFGPRIDASRIGVAGFSLGGYTALAAVGARLSRAQWDRHCAAQPADPSGCKLPPEAKFTMDEARQLIENDERVKAAYARMGDPYGDARVKAAFAIAPVLGPALTAESLAQIAVPVRIVVGARDDQAVPERNAKPMAAQIAGAELDVLPDVGHYTMLPTCNAFGRRVASAICTDADGVDRAATHRAVSAQALAFFERTLKGAATTPR